MASIAPATEGGCNQSFLLILRLLPRDYMLHLGWSYFLSPKLGIFHEFDSWKNRFKYLKWDHSEKYETISNDLMYMFILNNGLHIISIF